MRRDGTELHSTHYADGVWVRWQRGLPRKMGGYRASSQVANGPVRSVLVDSRNGVISAHFFSPWGIQRQQLSASGSGGSLDDRTPLGFARNDLLTWTHGLMYSQTGGAYTALLAAATPDLDDITSDATGTVYTGDATTTGRMSVVSDSVGPVAVSGGLCVLQPFLFVYGSNGLIRNSNPNNFSAATGWTTGGGNFANSANVAGTKFVYGTQVRGGGQSPAGLFWSLDSLVRVSFVGGAAIWNYDTLSSPISVLSKKAIVEHEGKFFWPAMGRFMFYAGTVQELPNDMNLNYFYDNLNYAARNKIWGTKIQRWGEIWWFYPRGSATECTDAIIFNYRENTWYDAVLQRSAGDVALNFQFPVWAGPESGTKTESLSIGFIVLNTVTSAINANTVTLANTTDVVVGQKILAQGVPYNSTVLSKTATVVTFDSNLTEALPAGSEVTFTSSTGVFQVGSTVTGSTSGATGVVVRASFIQLNLKIVAGTFSINEALTSTASNAVLRGLSTPQQLDTAFQHEIGYDKIVGQDVSPIISSFTSQNFGFATGSPFEAAAKTVDVMSRLVRMEPDFNQVGNLTVRVEGRSYPTDDPSVLNEYVITPKQAFQDMRDQERLLRITIESNSLGGYFEQGQVMVTVEPGDERSSSNT